MIIVRIYLKSGDRESIEVDNMEDAIAKVAHFEEMKRATDSLIQKIKILQL